jgi:hypothetical protein
MRLDKEVLAQAISDAIFAAMGVLVREQYTDDDFEKDIGLKT